MGGVRANAISLLVDDHAEVCGLLLALRQAPRDARRPLLRELSHCIDRMLRAEETILAPIEKPLANAMPLDGWPFGSAGVDGIRRAVQDVERVVGQRRAFEVALRRLMDHVALQADAHEALVFPLLRRHCSPRQLRALATEVVQQRNAHTEVDASFVSALHRTD